MTHKAELEKLQEKARRAGRKVKGAKFHTLKIGDVFHNGKSKGMGARSHVTSWEIIEKISKTQGRVIDCAGDYHSEGAVYAFAGGSYVFAYVND